MPAARLGYRPSPGGSTMVQDAKQQSPRFPVAVAVTVAATVALLAPLPEGPEGPPFEVPYLDKLAHLLVFATLALVWRRVAAQAGRADGISRFGVLAALVAYGAVIELLQGLSGWRAFEWGDLAADALGAAAVLVVGTLAAERPGGAIASATRVRRTIPPPPQPGRTEVDSE